MPDFHCHISAIDSLHDRQVLIPRLNALSKLRDSCEGECASKLALPGLHLDAVGAFAEQYEELVFGLKCLDNLWNSGIDCGRLCEGRAIYIWFFSSSAAAA
jgi:hypothetical protein